MRFEVKIRSSHPEVFYKKDVLRNFAKFTGKHLCQRLFLNKVAGLRPKACNFIKKSLWRRCFPVNFCEISKNTLFHRTPPVAASERCRSFSYFLPQVFFSQFCYTLIFIYKQLGSGVIPQSCLYFQGFMGSKLFNVCLAV